MLLQRDELQTEHGCPRTYLYPRASLIMTFPFKLPAGATAGKKSIQLLSWDTNPEPSHPEQGSSHWKRLQTPPPSLLESPTSARDPETFWKE